MHIEKMKNGLNFLQGTLCNVPFPTKMPRTIALCLVYFTVGLSHIELAKAFAYKPNKTFRS